MITHVSSHLIFSLLFLFSSPNIGWRLFSPDVCLQRCLGCHFLLFSVTSAIHHCACGAFQLHKFHIIYITARFIAFAMPSARFAVHLCMCECVNVCCSFSKYLQLLTNFASDCRLLKSIHYCVFSNFMHILHVYLHTYGILNI